MDGLETQLAQMKEYLEELRTERIASKEKEKREAWTKYTAVSVVFVAVFAAIATQWNARYANGTLKALNDATFHQSKASDAWSYYQAKSIKQSLVEGMPSEKGQDAAARIARYEQEKAAIKEDATKLEAARDKARADSARVSERGAGMGTAVAAYQVAIAIASISMIVKKKPFWFAALALAAVATIQMVVVFLS